ncbi:MAG: hypothetical protein EA403_02465 [Spirochaetaceae bacterium]|nr:MAG: hypothetical protein EA403_02465 [Spirochaetaceae bacterium]
MSLLSIAELTQVERSLLVVFCLVGAIGVASVSRGPGRSVTVAALAHVVGGLLSLFAGDLITLLVSWEILAISAFVVIRAFVIRPHSNGATVAAVDDMDRTSRVAFHYLVVQIAAAVLFFVAIVVQYSYQRTVRITALVPAASGWIIAAVAIKTAMIPAHGWLITTYGAVPSFSLVLLAAFSTKVGALTAARLVPEGGYTGLVWLAAAVAAVAPWMAVRQYSMRRLLSYVLIAQVAMVLVGVGLSGGDGPGAARDLALTAARFHTVNHILYKTLLFVVAAMVMERVGHDDLRYMGGLWRSMPLALGAGIVGVGAGIGAPFLNGFTSKELLKHVVESPYIGVLLTVSTVGTALALFRFLDGAFFGRASAPTADRPAGSLWLTVSAPLLALICVLGGLLPTVVSGVSEPRVYSAAAIRSAMILLAAVLLGWIGVRHSLLAAAPGSQWGEKAFTGLGARLYAAVTWGALGVRRADPRTLVGLTVVLVVVVVLALVGVW